MLCSESNLIRSSCIGIICKCDRSLLMMMLVIPTPENSLNDSSELLVLESEFPDLLDPSSQLFVGWRNSPNLFHLVAPLLFHNVPKEPLKSLVLLIPSIENLKAGSHYLVKISIWQHHKPAKETIRQVKTESKERY